MMTGTYLDHAATTTLRPVASIAMAEAYASGNANASGQHGPARTAKNALEEAREQAAEIFGSSRPLDVVFTSGGTEADNLAVCGVALASEKRSIVISAVEHEAVLRSAESLERFGYSVVLAGVDGSCVVDPNEVASLVGRDTAVVSVMAANNEVGTVEPIERSSRPSRVSMTRYPCTRTRLRLSFQKTSLFGPLRLISSRYLPTNLADQRVSAFSLWILRFASIQ